MSTLPNGSAKDGFAKERPASRVPSAAPAVDGPPMVAWTSLEPYLQVLRALLPRLTHLSVFDATGALHWSSEIAVDSELLQLIPETLAAAAAEPQAPGEQRIAGQEQAYLFWLRRDDGVPSTAPFAVVAIGCRAGTGEGERRSFSFVHGLVRPAIECLRRELMAREEILTLHTSLLAQDSDLTMLLSVTGSEGRPEASADMRAIVASATEQLSAGLAAMIVPDNSIALVQPADREPLEPALVARAHRHLLALVKARRQAVIVNQMRLPGGAIDKSAYRVLAAPILRADGRPAGVLALFRAGSAPEFTAHHGRLTELLARRIGSILAHSYDALTGLMTRPAFEQRVQRAIDESAPNQTPWCALYLDINRLQLVNDRCGMHVGDRLIAQLAELIRSRLPPGALAGRFAGDRFSMLLPSALPAAMAFAEALRAGAEACGRGLAERELPISVSIGIASIDASHSQEFAHAFAAAEAACKLANERGRNRVEIYRETDEAAARRLNDTHVIEDLRAAVAEQRLQLHAQVIAPLSASGPARFEILLRMLDHNGTMVGPDHFMSAAQRYQLMPTIDRWVIGRAIDLLRPHAALLEGGGAVFAVNFSGQSLLDPEFCEHVAKLIEDSGLNPAALCFELSESAAIANLAQAETLMRRLRRLGCNVALDDFGAGLSSLAYLRTLPIGMLKIDGSFVRDVLQDPRAESMVQTVAQLARALSLATVAECVETEEIRARIAALGVDYAQGFAIARPEPLSELLAELPLHIAAASSAAAWHAQAAFGAGSA